MAETLPQSSSVPLLALPWRVRVWGILHASSPHKQELQILVTRFGEEGMILREGVAKPLGPSGTVKVEGTRRPISLSRTESEMAFYWEGHLSPWSGILSLMNPQSRPNRSRRGRWPHTQVLSFPPLHPHRISNTYNLGAAPLTGDPGHIHQRLTKWGTK